MNFKDPENWMSPKDLQWLYDQTKKYKSIVEVGSHKGRGSSTVLASGALISGSTLTCVDCFEDDGWYYSFKENILNKYPFVRLIREKSLDAAKRFVPKSVEMVFIDAGHSYESVRDDIAAWTPVASKLICGHDYGSGWHGVKKAVDECFPSIELVDTIWIVKL